MQCAVNKSSFLSLSLSPLLTFLSSRYKDIKTLGFCFRFVPENIKSKKELSSYVSTLRFKQDNTKRERERESKKNSKGFLYSKRAAAVLFSFQFFPLISGSFCFTAGLEYRRETPEKNKIYSQRWWKIIFWSLVSLTLLSLSLSLSLSLFLLLFFHFLVLFLLLFSNLKRKKERKKRATLILLQPRDWRRNERCPKTTIDGNLIDDSSRVRVEVPRATRKLQKKERKGFSGDVSPLRKKLFFQND